MRDIIAVVVAGKKLADFQVNFEVMVSLKSRATIDEMELAAEVFVMQEEIAEKWDGSKSIHWIITLSNRGETITREFVLNDNMHWIIRDMCEEVFEIQ